MRKRSLAFLTKAGISLLLLCVCVVLLGGCETCKGMGRDWGTVKKADQWFKENYW